MFRKGDKQWQSSGYRCGWCGDDIPEDTELFGISAKARADMDITALEGKVIDVFLTRRDRTVKAWVVTKDSPAKKDGKDLLL